MKKIIAIGCAALWVGGCASPMPENPRPEPAAEVDTASTPDAGGGAPGTETTASVVPEVKKDRCRVERVAGSNIPKRICLSDEEWDEVRGVSQQFYEVISRPMNAPPER